MQRFCTELSEAVREENGAAQRGRVLMEQLIEAGDEELKDLQEEKQNKETRRRECEHLVAEINGPGDADSSPETTKSLRVIRKEKRDLGRRIARIGDTVVLREQTEKIRELLDKAGRYARERIKQELIKECNDRLSQILANDPLAIERIDQSIHLRGQQGASAGQTLAIGYTFLMSVLNRGMNDFPLVVDSPAGSLDTSVRRQIGGLLPSLCSQFVGFTINTERVGFVDALENNVDDIVFLTLFRKTRGTRRMMRDLPSGHYQETDTAILVADREYFFNFDIEKEDEDAVHSS